MTIAFLPLDQDCQCFTPGLGKPDGFCQTCEEHFPRSPNLQKLFALDAAQIPQLASVVVLNGAWQACLEHLAELWATLLPSFSHRPDYLTWQQAAQQLQSSLPQWSEAELAPLHRVIQAWHCPWLRLTPEITGPDADCFSSSRISPMTVRAENLASGLTEVYRCLFQAKQLILWEHDQISPTDLTVEILIQPLQACVASGWAEYHDGCWEIKAVTGVLESELQGRVIPDHYVLEGASFTRLRSERGQKTQVLTLREQGLVSQPLPHAVAQVEVLSSEHLSWLASLLQSLRSLPRVEEFQYAWQIPVDLLQAQLTAVCPIESAPNYTPQELELTPVGQGIVAAGGQALAMALVITPETPAPDFSQLLPGYILVVDQFQLDWLPGLRWAAGLVCERGGLTSHGAILARELGRPAVIGLEAATTRIRTGELLFLDGQTGTISRCTGLRPPRQADCAEPVAFKPSSTFIQARGTLLSAQTNQPLWVNLSQTESLQKLPHLPLAGIGLLRSEMLFRELLRGKHPDDWLAPAHLQEYQTQWLESLTPFFQTFAPRPIFYRALDLRSTDLDHLLGQKSHEPKETNPDLGLRGLARICLNPQLFRLELAVLSQLLQRYPLPLRLVLPFARSVAEVAFCQQEIQASGLGHFPNLQVWVMAETPAMLFMLPDLAGLGIQGISIGSNDLTQLLLGVDRDHAILSSHLNESHPAVQAAIRQLIQTAKGLGLGCRICGEAPGLHLDWLEWLIELGIDGISLAPERLPQAWAFLHQSHLRVTTPSS